ncbi:MAG: GMC family oxidoreductase [Proteobacteria bacterium]|nr:GMC family oxidoreductase [Pseudomonadota bacterium]
MIADIVEKQWDVIVIGAGLGGGVVGRRLAEQGLSVLFVERGPFGPRTEQQQLRTDIEDPNARRIRGFWPTPLNAKIDGRQTLFFGPVGSGVGGSSAFYAATLERPERHDLDDSAARPHPTGGWPEKYDAYRPYFEAAERMFEVCGENDPLSPDTATTLIPPPALTEGDHAMIDGFKRKGLNPYRLHMGVRFLPGCNMCFGYKCPRTCKMDGRSAGVEPAVATGRATVLDMCDVLALRGSNGSISHIEAEKSGERLKLRAKRYILAGGGLGSPRLLLASRSEEWPDGCANGSGLVGRNLMFHLAEMIAIWPESGISFNGPTKAIALRDLYFIDGNRYGAVQAIGIDASYGEIAHYLKNIFDRSALHKLKPLRQLTRIPAFVAARVFGDAKVFRAIIEDLPYQDNRVLLDETDPGRLRFEYAVQPELQRRRREFRRLLKRRLGGQRSVFLTFQPELDFAHACGTVRFGEDPATSVLNRDCRAHEVENLYVTDASFMPTSTGINPSLTIAANALRVADRIVARI